MKFMKDTLGKVASIKKLMKEADYILIGAGAGLSTAAGIEYSGSRFTKYFTEYIQKYHFTDMYTSSFYEFETEEEKWAYWAKHIYVNNTGMEATKLYQDILKLVKNKEYFVITTNVDEQFAKTGFEEGKIFATQGSYRFLQCQKACHNQLYDDTELVEKMLKATKNLKIPIELVPKCPVCGGKMEVNLRKDAYFVQDDNWYEQNRKYGEFLEKTANQQVVLLEFGVGFNTPGIISIPFEQMTYQKKNWNLVRFNKEYTGTYLNIKDRNIEVNEEIKEIISSLLE